MPHQLNRISRAGWIEKDGTRIFSMPVSENESEQDSFTGSYGSISEQSNDKKLRLQKEISVKRMRKNKSLVMKNESQFQREIPLDY